MGGLDLVRGLGLGEAVASHNVGELRVRAELVEAKTMADRWDPPVSG
jgi:hypothetical protein